MTPNESSRMKNEINSNEIANKLVHTYIHIHTYVYVCIYMYVLHTFLFIYTPLKIQKYYLINAHIYVFTCGGVYVNI